ncbi:ATP-binding protein [uncultured Tateyamaria sp.]|uniref:ATP-binding protein n=1 Tax=uncultured Tateyamaria sp. TaxID=455651 RepID=UPI002607BA6D|nr:ATP-binding protein [uncultured Tateyamaria sp.]
MNLELFQTLSSSPSTEAIDALCQSIQELSGGRAVAVYILDTSVGEFILIFARGQEFPESFSPDELAEVRNLIGESSGKFLEFPSLRGAQAVGYTFVVGDCSHPDSVAVHTQFLSFLFNRTQTERLHGGLNKPISFDLPQDKFFEELKKLSIESTGIQFGAFRSLNGHMLDCLFCWGFEAKISHCSELSLPKDALPPLLDAMETRRVQSVANLALSTPDITRTYDFLEGISSFCAVPVLVGKKVSGVLSVASSAPYEFSDSEKNGLLCVANGIGVSLSNFRQFWQGQTKGAEFEKISSAIVGVEVAQSIRHSIRNLAGAVVTDLSSLEAEINKISLTNKQADRVSRLISRAESNAHEVQVEVGNMKDVMSVDRTVQLTNIKTLWGECVQHLGHRLEENDVRCDAVRGTEVVPMLTDMVKHVFHNLLLNSLDAFEDSQRSARKEISLSISSVDRRARKIHLIYRDNGPGLDRAYLEQERTRLAEDILIPDVSLETALGELIFRPQVTTRGDGGFGLWVCRRMADYHCGGIEYSEPESNRGVSFKIEFSYDLEALSEEHQGALFEVVDGKKVPLDLPEFVRRARK